MPGTKLVLFESTVVGLVKLGKSTPGFILLIQSQIPASEQKKIGDSSPS